mmetsp:Transcript_50315/g.103562  ORF Transcript_50315/g.103562 Transcript_50315/m.103562 type:complete len:100 (-) Transcript_50315:531-830(-)
MVFENRHPRIEIRILASVQKVDAIASPVFVESKRCCRSSSSNRNTILCQLHRTISGMDYVSETALGFRQSVLRVIKCGSGGRRFVFPHEIHLPVTDAVY